MVPPIFTRIRSYCEASDFLAEVVATMTFSGVSFYHAMNVQVFQKVR